MGCEELPWQVVHVECPEDSHIPCGFISLYTNHELNKAPNMEVLDRLRARLGHQDEEEGGIPPMWHLDYDWFYENILRHDPTVKRVMAWYKRVTASN